MVDVNPVVLTVTQLNRYVKSVIDSDYNLNCIFLTAELSNFVSNLRSGHMYFTLKDENCAVKAVMFRNNAARLKFEPFDGMNVIIRGRVSVFETTGQYQVYVDDMQPDGVGALAMSFEQLKDRLEREGLFDASHKKPIPKFPERVGVITSPTGAAVQDIIKILNRRFKCAEVVFYPAQVQGEEAVGQLIEGIRYMDAQNAADVIIIGRGGGSMEDLWAFNSEALAREVYNCKIPIISAVGHETDFTIIDFAADLRAATPSAAAELAVPDSSEQKAYINKLCSSLKNSIAAMLNSRREKLDFITDRSFLGKPEALIANERLILDKYSYSLYNLEDNLFKLRRAEFAALASKLNALSPLNVLARGYSVAYKDEKIIKSAGEINIKDELKICFNDGAVVCDVKEKI